MDSYVYHDRKMLKWMPFSALTEQGTYLQDLLSQKTKVEMPILSADDYAYMNYIIDEALALNQAVLVTYFNHGKKEMIEGKISQCQVYNRTIQINDHLLNASQIMSIEKAWKISIFAWFCDIIP